MNRGLISQTHGSPGNVSILDNVRVRTTSLTAPDCIIANPLLVPSPFVSPFASPEVTGDLSYLLSSDT